MNKIIMSKTLNILKKLILAHILFLIIMTLFRIVFFNYYSPIDNLSKYYIDLLNAFFLGFRIDLTVIGYIQALATIILIILYYLKKESFLNFANRFFVYYLFITYTIVSFFLCADFGFYSYFKDHINILIFGFLDDDTKALLITFWQNYNVILILFIFFIYLIVLYYAINRIFKIKDNSITFFNFFRFSPLLFLFLFILNFLIIRGTLGMYPLGKMIPNVSENEFINKVSHNGLRSFTNALSARKKYLRKNYNLLKITGFDKNIEKAFEIYKDSKNINRDDLLENIRYKTKKVDNKDYNVVVVMVESFGMPIIKYQSKDFDILGELKKHFDEDILLTNFISSGDGTISSLQALLLNIPHRPSSFAFSQSIYKQTSFTYSPAFLFNKQGYESSFIYGGDLTWRDLGSFVKYQNYNNIEGKINIYNNLEKEGTNEDFFHPWGIYDEYLYSHILQKLENSNEKQFILALSTNNHPPYNIPKNYKSKKLLISDDLKKHITGEYNLAKQRIKSYAYALNQVGIFLDKLKASKYKDNTIVVVTADNNTIDGIMEYDNNKLLNSKNIPLYFYLPDSLKNKLTINTKIEGSHKDIFPTLYNLVLKNQEYISIGTNLFDSKEKHFGFNGSRIVFNNGEIKKYNKLKDDSKDKMLNYYRASLAISEYLVRYEYQKGKK